MPKCNISQKDRRKVAKDLRVVLNAIYFDGGVPIDDITESFEWNDLVLLQEDNTEWSGFFCGAEGEAFIRVAHKDNIEGYYDGHPHYKPYDNTGLKLTWYRCNSRTDNKYEVIGYLS